MRGQVLRFNSQSDVHHSRLNRLDALMSWNYRVIEFDNAAPEPPHREIREVYYNDQGQPCAYGNVGQLVWSVDDIDAPHTILENMRGALEKPILLAKDFDGAAAPSAATPDTGCTVHFEKMPNSEDLFLQLPPAFLGAHDWREGDVLDFKPTAGAFTITNTTKEKRDGIHP